MTPAPTVSPNPTRYILIAIALIGLTLLLWKIVDALVIAFGGIVLAAVLRALATPVGRLTGLSSRWSLAVVIVGLVVFFGLLGWLFGAQAARQFEQLRQQLPEAVEKFQLWLERSGPGKALVDTVEQAAGDGKMFSQFGLAAGATIGGIGNLLLIVFLGIYFAADPGLYRRGALRLFPPTRRAQVGSALDDAGVALRKWLVAQLVIMVGVGILTSVGLAIAGVPLALLLGVLAGLFEFVPVVGPIVAAIPGLLLAFAAGPTTVMYAAIVYVVVQQIESNVLTPIVQRWAVALPPVVALLSIVMFGLLFGVMGVVFATPLAVVTVALVQHLYVEDTLERRRGPSVAQKT